MSGGRPVRERRGCAQRFASSRSGAALRWTSPAAMPRAARVGRPANGGSAPVRTHSVRAHSGSRAAWRSTRSSSRSKYTASRVEPLASGSMRPTMAGHGVEHGGIHVPLAVEPHERAAPGSVGTLRAGLEAECRFQLACPAVQGLLVHELEDGARRRDAPVLEAPLWRQRVVGQLSGTVGTLQIREVTHFPREAGSACWAAPSTCVPKGFVRRPSSESARSPLSPTRRRCDRYARRI